MRVLFICMLIFLGSCIRHAGTGGYHKYHIYTLMYEKDNLEIFYCRRLPCDRVDTLINHHHSYRNTVHGQ